MNHIELAHKTFQLAEVDREVALEQIEKASEIYYRVAFFHLQQATEKYLKAYLYFTQRPVPQTHKLDFLNRLCREVNPDIPEFETKVFIDFGVHVRYADVKYVGPMQADVKYAFTCCLEVRQALLPHFPPGVVNPYLILPNAAD